MLTIRLQRRGRRNTAAFRVVVVESKKKPKTGAYLEMVGSYNPHLNQTQLNAERVKHWLAEGVTVSGTVHNIFVSNGLISGPKINVLPKKTPPAKPAPAAPAADVPDTTTDTVSSDDTQPVVNEVAS